MSFRRVLRTVLIQVALVASVVAVTMMAGRLWFGSLSAAVASAYGYSLYCENPDEQIGDIPASSFGEATFRFRNLTDVPIKIAGAETSCSCVTLSDFPMIVGPYSVASVEVQLHVDESDVGQAISGEFLVFVNVANPEIVCHVSGDVVSTAKQIATP